MIDWEPVDIVAILMPVGLIVGLIVLIVKDCERDAFLRERNLARCREVCQPFDVDKSTSTICICDTTKIVKK